VVTNYDPTSALTGFASTLSTTAGPIIIAVSTAMIGLTLLFWGVRYVKGFLGKRHA